MFDTLVVVSILFIFKVLPRDSMHCNPQKTLDDYSSDGKSDVLDLKLANRTATTRTSSPQSVL
jgi:hypothetical protein